MQVSGGQPTGALPDFGAQTPLGRPGQPAECAPAYVLLASAESGCLSGQTLRVTAGMPTADSRRQYAQSTSDQTRVSDRRTQQLSPGGALGLEAFVDDRRTQTQGS